MAYEQEAVFGEYVDVKTLELIVLLERLGDAPLP